MTGLLDEGAFGPVFPGQNHGNMCPELEPHNKFHILIQNLKTFKLYPALQSDCRLVMHEQRRTFSPKKQL